MCGRFNFSADEDEQVKEIIAEVSRRLYGDAPPIRTGEIFPTNAVPVLLPGEGKPVPKPMAWGFPRFNAKGVIINARSETALERPMFRGSVLGRRCVIPTTGFYEWQKLDGGKQKYIFHLPGTKLLYLAGFWNTFQGEERFVILTTEANDSIRDVHDRMPVVLRPEECHDWLGDDCDMHRLFDRSGVRLERAVA